MRHLVLACLPLAACVAPDGATALPDPPEIAFDDGGDALSVLGIELLAESATLRPGQVVELGVRTAGNGVGQVEWSVDEGQILGRRQGRASWLVPDVAQATVRAVVRPRGTGEELEAVGVFDIAVDEVKDLSWTVNPLAVGLVDPTPDSISSCKLAFDSADNPNILYRSADHSQLWWARWQGSSWTITFVDGPGFDVGGLVQNQFDFVLGSSGTPHIAYWYSDYEAPRYATVNGSTWIREAASTLETASGSYAIAIALDPIQGNRPTIVFPHYYSVGNDRVTAVTYRTAPNTWTSSPNLTGGYYDEPTGSVAFTASGVAWIGYGTQSLRVVNWSNANGFFDAAVLANGYGASTSRMRLDGSNQPMMIEAYSVWHRVGGAWQSSTYENGSTSWYDLARDVSGDPRLGVRHDNVLELVHTNAEGYWQYTQVGPVDSARFGVAVDSADQTHACYVDAGQLYFY